MDLFTGLCDGKRRDAFADGHPMNSLQTKKHDMPITSCSGTQELYWVQVEESVFYHLQGLLGS